MERNFKILILLFLFFAPRAYSASIGEMVKDNSQYIGCAASVAVGFMLSSDNALPIGAAGCAVSFATNYHLNKVIDDKNNETVSLTEKQVEVLRRAVERNRLEEARKYEVYKNVIRRAVAKKLKEQDSKIKRLEVQKKNLANTVLENKAEKDEVQEYINKLRNAEEK